VTWKQNGIKHDTKNNRVRLSEGANHKQHPKAWEYMLIEYETAPGVTVENLQQVRVVYNNKRGRWELHLVCKDEIETPTAPGTETAGIDLGSACATSPLSLLRTAPRKPTSTPAIA
jgi:putative transposase